MRCQSCEQEEATIHYFESVNGATRSLNLCERCAGASAPAMQFPILRVSEVELTGGEAATPEAAEAFNQLALPLEEPAACVGCGRSYADFRHDPRHACPACFDNFATPAQLRRRMGMPGGTREALQARLKRAVDQEEFEEAARLRDLIRKDSTASATRPGL